MGWLFEVHNCVDLAGSRKRFSDSELRADLSAVKVGRNEVNSQSGHYKRPIYHAHLDSLPNQGTGNFR